MWVRRMILNARLTCLVVVVKERDARLWVILVYIGLGLDGVGVCYLGWTVVLVSSQAGG